MSDLSVIFALIFVAASLAIYGVYWIFVFNRRAYKIVNRRLELSKQLEFIGRSGNLAAGAGLPQRYQSRFASVQRLADSDRDPSTTHVPRSGVHSALSGIDVGLQSAAGHGTYIACPCRFCGGRGVIYFYLARKRSRRIFAFSEQLPDAIDVIVRGVRVGLPFSSAVALVAREMPDPVGTEFGMLADEIAFGLDVRTALQNLYRRVGQEDLLFLTVSLSIQTQTGGNIGEILTRLSRLMRKSGRDATESQGAERRRSSIGVFLVRLSIHSAIGHQFSFAEIFRSGSIVCKS